MTSWEHSSESNEHYTPEKIVELVRGLMGAIDLDPASSEVANRRVRATRFYSQGGEIPFWRGRVFLNPPGGTCDKDFRTVIKADKAKGRKPCSETGDCGLPPGHKHEGLDSSAKKWWFKLVKEWRELRVSQAIFVGFSLEMLQTMQVDTPEGLPTPLDVPLCFPRTRVAYDRLGPEGSLVKGASPPHASFIAYLPILYLPGSSDAREDCRRFIKTFSPLGRVISGGWLL